MAHGPSFFTFFVLRFTFCHAGSIHTVINSHFRRADFTICLFRTYVFDHYVTLRYVMLR